MQELAAKIAEAHGYPVDMVMRSAYARAGAEGKPVEVVIAEWAGEEVPAGAASVPAAEPATPTPVADAAPADPGGEVADAGPVVEVLEPLAEAAPVSEPEPEPVKSPGLPRWLVAAFVIIPALALLYGMTGPNGPDCGTAGQLAIDPATGVAENCDGTAYGFEVVNFFTIGRDIYDNGLGSRGAACASCHGSAGGGGTGPAFTGGAIVEVFSQCVDHVEWVAIGSNDWPDATYGDTAKPVLGSGAAMPGYPDLTPEELASVVLYERVAFGGEDFGTAQGACGLTDEAVEAAG
ncbi:MAG: hypothetical protein HKN93_09110 [Acidimicrobiia bacterium]|nr:hypothetical protein [Acidimicrobiia bacterium]